METAGQSDVVFLRPGRGKAGYADGERAAGECVPRCLGRRPEISTVLDPRNRVEGVTVDGLIFGIGLVRGERTAGDPGNGGSGEVEPRDLGNI